MQLDDPSTPGGRARIRRTLSIDVPGAELIESWRQTAVQQQVLAHFAVLVAEGAAAGSTRWRIQGPLGKEMDWETRETAYEPGSRVRHEGAFGGGHSASTELSVRAAPADFGTEATLLVDYDAPGGALTDALLKMLGAAPDMLVATALRRFKALVESGEIPTLTRNPSARADDDDTDAGSAAAPASATHD